MGSGVDPSMILRAFALDNPLDASRGRNHDCSGGDGSAATRCA